MTSLTLAVPPELKSKMDAHPELNWSAIARIAIQEKIDELELVRKFKENSTATEKDAVLLGKELNKRLGERWRDATRD